MRLKLVDRLTALKGPGSTLAPEPPAAEVTASSPGRKPWLFTVIKSLVSLVLITWILRSTDLAEIGIAIRSATLSLVLLAALLHVVGHTLSAVRWRTLLQAQGLQVQLIYLVKSHVVGLFFNHFLPSTIGGDSVRAYDSWRVGRNKAKAVAVILVDRFLGVLALVFFAAGALLFSDELAAAFPFLYGLVPLMAVAGFLLAWLLFWPPGRFVELAARLRLPFLRQLQDRFVEALTLFQGQTAVLHKALGLSLLLQANVVLYYYLIARALNFSVPLSAFFVIIPLALLLMVVPISINAIGIRENIFIVFLAVYGVSRPEAVAFAWIAYGLLIVQGVIGGVVYARR
jgi:glycosyltransferase 2 family protein